MGPERRRAAAGLPANRNRRGAGAALRYRCRPHLGQLTLAALLRVGVDDQAFDPPRQLRYRAGPASLGEPGPDDVLLPRRRARGQARTRDRSTAGVAQRGGPAGGSPWRHGSAGSHLPDLQSRRCGRAWLGSCNVHRHGVCVGSPRSSGARRHAPQGAAPHGGGGRRSHRSDRDRHRVHGQHIAGSASGRDRSVRRPHRPFAMRPTRGVPRLPPWWASRFGWLCTRRGSIP